jgi:hypothetical protein
MRVNKVKGYAMLDPTKQTSIIVFRMLLAALLAWHFPVHAQAVTGSPRFALLVGVDLYAQPADQAARITPLKGPRNDVEIVKQLLNEKYGFSTPQTQIITLLGKEATRSSIEKAFKSHLIENAAKNPGAKVLFYFSGHGSQTTDETGTEGDKFEETLVAYDSRAGNGRDILDKEIADWLRALRQHTTNITVILDSCHSGDATKDVSRFPLVARRLPPNPNMVLTGTRGQAAMGASVRSRALLPPSHEYVSVAGSGPDELSNEGMVLDDNGQGRYYGFLTYYLVRALRLNPGLTYEQLISSITLDVRRRAPSQTPRAEGNVSIPFLGESLDRESPYIRISDAGDGKKLTIAAGGILGVSTGSLISVYSQESRKLVGESGKLANGRVTDVKLDAAHVVLIDNPARPITKEDKVVMIGALAGTRPVPIDLSRLPGQTTSPKDRQLLASVAELLKENRLVQIVSGDEWSFAIQRGCRAAERFHPSSQLSAAPTNCEAVYYVAPRDNRDRAMASLLVPVAEVRDSAARIADYIGLKARQESLRAFDNAQSSLKEFLKVSVIKRKGADGSAVDQALAGSIPKIREGEEFELQIANASDKDLHFATLQLGTSGRTYLYSLSAQGDLLVAGRTIRIRPRFKAGLPAGIETYKIIATTRKDVNFRVLESAESRAAAGSSAFGLLLKGLSDASTKDSPPVVDLNLDEWVTKTIDIEVTK